jgi:phosphoribosylformylglycinamidine cyclo-ligase
VHSTTAQHLPALLGIPYKMTQESLSYRDAGVDIDAGDQLVERIKPFARKTLREGVLGGIGGFGALFEVPRRYREPVLVSGTDGVGTKLKLAFELQRHDTIGIDLVAMSVNDILVQGAEPLFFLDYFACGKLDVDTAADVVKGIARGCELAGCALIGGETAEMPGMYPAGEYDLAGFAVGVVEKVGDHRRLDDRSGGRAARPAVIGRAFQRLFAAAEDHCPRAAGPDAGLRRRNDARRSDPGADADLCQALLALMQALPVKGMAHITGGGLTGNVPRILPPAVKAEIAQAAWPRPKLFDWLQREGGVADSEMHRVFNCGIGMVVVVAREDVQQALQILHAAGEAGSGHRGDQGARRGGSGDVSG